VLRAQVRDVVRAFPEPLWHGVLFVLALFATYLVVGGIGALLGFDPETSGVPVALGLILALASAGWVVLVRDPRVARDGLVVGSLLIVVALSVLPFGSPVDDTEIREGQIATLVGVLPTFLIVFAVEWLAVRPAPLAVTLVAVWSSAVIGVTEIIAFGNMDDPENYDDVLSAGFRALIVGVVGAVFLPLITIAERRLGEAVAAERDAV
jgi:hypothetical protein